MISQSDDAYVEVRPKLRIAIVGGGIAGMGAAWAFKRADEAKQYQVTLIDSRDRLGGAAFTHYDTSSGTPVDLGFHAFINYYNFEYLLDTLNISSELSSSTFAAVYPNNTVDGGPEIFSTALPPSLGNVNQIEKYISDIDRLERLITFAIENWNEAKLMETTLSQILTNFTDDFKYNYLSACLQVYVAAGATVMDMPVAFFFAFEERFHLCTTPSRVRGRSVIGGVGRYVAALQSFLESNGESGNVVKVRLNTRVEAVRQGGSVVRIQMGDTGSWEEFDHVIFAAPRETFRSIMRSRNSSVCNLGNTKRSVACAKLYDGLFGIDSAVLDGQDAFTMVHNDTDLTTRMLEPLQDSDGCWNLVLYNAFSTEQNKTTKMWKHFAMLPPSVRSPTSDWKCSRELPQPMLLFSYLPYTGLSATLKPRASALLAQANWHHTSHNTKFFKVGRNTHLVQGLGGVWFAGVDYIVNFHEEAFVSGLVIAHRLGAGYAFKDSSLALAEFLRVRSWMLYGLNPLLPFTVERGGRT